MEAHRGAVASFPHILLKKHPFSNVLEDVTDRKMLSPSRKHAGEKARVSLSSMLSRY